MSLHTAIMKIVQQEDLNFLLTNRLPRRWLTRAVGRLSRVEQPLVRDASIAVWRLFADLDLSDAETTRFRSVHDCFTRRLRPGARPIAPDPDALVSPCDAILGAAGRVEAGRLYQVKGFAYTLRELFGEADAAPFQDGCYATLRLTSGMYHRFHAPDDLRLEAVTYIPGDAWNVNPPTLRRVPRLYCRNERAVIRARLARDGTPVALVPVAAILVAGIRLHALDTERLLREHGPGTVRCEATLRRGEEMGWFEHGSTIVLFAPTGFRLRDGLAEGERVRMGEPLLRRT